MSNIDFDKIRKNSLKQYMDSFADDDSTVRLIEQIATISSEISKIMLIKYHEELNKVDD